jgi:hypothetical protein
LYLNFTRSFLNIKKIYSLAIEYYPGLYIINKLYYIILCFKGNLKEIVLAIRLRVYLFYNRLDRRNIKFIKPKDNTLLIGIYEL